MDSMIYNPVEDYQKKFKELHAENTKNFFEELVKTSGVDIELNKKTVEQYNAFKESLKKYNYQGTLNSESSFSERLPKENELKWQTFEREVYETLL